MVKYDVQLDAVFKALAHPARRSMLARLSQGEATVGELAEPLRMSPPAVTKHIKVLMRARLITQGRDAQLRPCRLEEAPLRTASEWLAHQREIAEGRLDRLEAHLHSMADDGKEISDDDA